MQVKRDGENLVITLTPAEANPLLEALDDAVNRYEAADEHDTEYYKSLRALLEALEQEALEQ
jgi:hypothetical protein